MQNTAEQNRPPKRDATCGVFISRGYSAYKVSLHSEYCDMLKKVNLGELKIAKVLLAHCVPRGIFTLKRESKIYLKTVVSKARAIAYCKTYAPNVEKKDHDIDIQLSLQHIQSLLHTSLFLL